MSVMLASKGAACRLWAGQRILWFQEASQALRPWAGERPGEPVLSRPGQAALARAGKPRLPLGRTWLLCARARGRGANALPLTNVPSPREMDAHRPGFVLARPSSGVLGSVSVVQSGSDSAAGVRQGDILAGKYPGVRVLGFHGL